MRLAVLADIHGNLAALTAVLEDMQRYEPDGVIVAGDLVDGGPQPNEIVRLLHSTRHWMIRGNGDTRLVGYDAGEGPPAWRTHLQYAILRWTHRHVDRDTLAFIKSLPEQRVVDVAGAAPIRVVHGSPRSPSESIFPDQDPMTLDSALAQVPEPVLVCGHTHIPWQVEQDGRLALNPGAVCGPLNGYIGAQYALLTWQDGRWQVEHRAVPYDIRQVRTAFQASGLLEEGGALARSFLCSIETGRDGAIDFLAHAYGLAEEAGFGECEFVPDEIWEQAAETFDWEAACYG